jgi:hypothetical protein
LNDRCSNSDDRKVKLNIGRDDSATNDVDCGSGVCNGGYKDEDNDNADWALWEESDHDLHMIKFHASSG